MSDTEPKKKSPKKIRHIRAEDELWIPACVAAEEDGMTVSELTRFLWREYLREKGKL